VTSWRGVKAKMKIIMWRIMKYRNEIMAKYQYQWRRGISACNNENESVMA
jgi:hypothetical protein